MNKCPIHQIEILKNKFPDKSFFTWKDWEILLKINYDSFLSNNLVIYDIGCHKGLHSDYILRNIPPKHLYAFEPVPQLCVNLKERYKSNSEIVSVLNYALSNKVGTDTFVIKDDLLSHSGLKERDSFQEKSSISTINIKVKTLDSLTLPLPDFIKIDVEGGELDLLEGSVQTIVNSRPIISVEYGWGGYNVYGHHKLDLFRFCEQAEYYITDLFGNVFLNEETFLQCVDQYYWDYILYPKEKIDKLSTKLQQIREKTNKYLDDIKNGSINKDYRENDSL